MDEIWKIIQDYPNYAISSYGRVRNLNTGRLLKHQTSSRGGNYSFVNLYFGGERKNKNVHNLVADAFLGECPYGMVVDHEDDNRNNPRLDNLEHKTHKENNHFNKKNLKELTHKG